MTKTHALSFAFAALLLSACELPRDADSIAGRWSTSCVSSGQLSRQYALVVGEGQFSYATREYALPRCQGDVFLEFAQSGSVEIKAVVVADAAQNVAAAPGKLILQFADSQLTPQSNAALSYFNAGAGICGAHDWRVGAARSVAGVDCGSDLGAFPASGQKRTQIFELRADGSLALGAAPEASLRLVEGVASTSFDAARIYYRQ